MRAGGAGLIAVALLLTGVAAPAAAQRVTRPCEDGSGDSGIALWLAPDPLADARHPLRRLAARVARRQARAASDTRAVESL
jgi:hypothetical protein